MGFKPQSKPLHLTFSDPEFEGLEISMRRVTVGQYRHILKVREDVDEADAVDEMLTLFVSSVHSWNLEDDQGATLPHTVDALNDLDYAFVDAVVETWMSELGGNSTPLPESSPAGEQSPVASIPTETLSASRAS